MDNTAGAQYQDWMGQPCYVGTRQVGALLATDQTSPSPLKNKTLSTQRLRTKGHWYTLVNPK